MNAKDASAHGQVTPAIRDTPVTRREPGNRTTTLSGWPARLQNSIQRAGKPRREQSVRAAAAPTRDSVTVLYGTETGNCMRVTRDLHRALDQAGLPNRWLNTGQYDLKELPHERCLLVAISTYDDEEPPEDALLFMGYVLSAKAPRLPQLQYGVLALGASCYSQYCTVGKQLDARLAELGATRLVALGLCDTDFQAAANTWIEQAIQRVRMAFNPEET